MAAWSAIAVALSVSIGSQIRDSAWRELVAASTIALVVVYLTYSRAGTVAALLAIALALALARRRSIVAIHAGTALVGATLAILTIRAHPEIANGTGGAGEAGRWLRPWPPPPRARPPPGSRRGGHAERDASPFPRARALIPLGLLAAVVASVAVGSGAGDKFRAPVGADPVDPAPSFDPAERLFDLEGPRAELWESALRAFASAPLGGIGPGTFEFWWNRDGAEPGAFRDAHSLYLEILAELGVPGLLALVALLGGLLAAALRGWQNARTSGEAGVAAALVCGYVVFLFYAAVDWIWESTAVTVLGLACACAVAAAASVPAPRRARRGPRTFAAVCLAVTAGAVQIPGIVAAERIRTSADELRLGDPAGAATLADEAVKPPGCDALRAAFLAALASGDTLTAVADARAAVRHEPTNWRHHLLLAQAHAERGDLASANAALSDVETLTRADAAALDALEDSISEIAERSKPLGADR